MKKRIAALALAFAMVLGTVALAAGTEKSITVSPMTLNINGQTVTPTKSNGEAAEVFAYNGATYVPLRYLSELLGIQVEWDKADPNTARLVGENIVLPAQPAGGYTPGTYVGVSENGMGGKVTVEVTVTADAIAKVEVTKHAETPGISTPALERIPGAIVEANSTEVEGVSGATLTSNAIKEAVSKALAVARGEAKAEEGNSKVSTELPFDKPDVLVIGCGFAGMNTALAAAEAGANVVALEKTGKWGGSANVGGSTLSGAGTKMQAEAGIVDTPELMVEEIEKRNAGNGGKENYNEQLTWYYARHSGEAVDWLDGLGVDLGDRVPRMPSLYEPMNVARVYSSGKISTYLEAVGNLLTAQVEAGKVAILYNTEATELIMDGKTVVGVKAETEDGTKLDFRAPATVMCTGGYGHSEELLHKYNFQNCLTTSPEFCTGDGFRFALQAGGVLKNMDYCSTYAGGVRDGDNFVKTLSVRVKDFPYMIFVNKDGQRFVDELGAADGSDYDEITSWWKKGDNTVYIMFDQAMVDTLHAKEMPIFSGDKDWSKWDTAVEKGQEVFKADSVAEAAKLAGIDAAGLEATVSRYNGFVAAGKDADFGRTREMQKFETGPYYIIRTIPYVMITSGGAWMNDKCQLLNEAGEPIPGLYQAGEMVGNANICGHTTFGGIQNTGCVVFGKQAGTQAAAYAAAGK